MMISRMDAGGAGVSAGTPAQDQPRDAQDIGVARPVLSVRRKGQTADCRINYTKSFSFLSTSKVCKHPSESQQQSVPDVAVEHQLGELRVVRAVPSRHLDKQP